MDVQQLPQLAHQPDITEYNFGNLLSFLVDDRHVHGRNAEDLCQLDPRDGSMIIYAEHRSLRQDEHQAKDSINQDNKTLLSTICPICAGKLTNVVDYAKQSEGFTFISQNMYPVLYPKNLRPDETAVQSLYPDPKHLGRAAFGFHLLQWTSSIHHLDWHNIPLSDALICMQRLSALEEKVLKQSAGYMPLSNMEDHFHGYVSIIKNYGAAAGASLTHGHQQIAFSNIMPQRTFNNCRFFQRHGKTFSEYLLSDNPESLTIAEYASVKIVIPYFMRRPFNVMILLDTQAEHLHQLSARILANMTMAMQKVIQTFHRLLPALGREVSYNMAIHTGPDNNVYVEFFPIIQASGGFERIGLWICQLSAQNAAAQFRALYQQEENR